jgi:hypothetical protein
MELQGRDDARGLAGIEDLAIPLGRPREVDVRPVGRRDDRDPLAADLGRLFAPPLDVFERLGAVGIIGRHGGAEPDDIRRLQARILQALGQVGQGLAALLELGQIVGPEFDAVEAGGSHGGDLLLHRGRTDGGDVHAQLPALFLHRRLLVGCRLRGSGGMVR